MDYESRNKVFDRAIFPESIRETTRGFKDVMGYIYLIQKKFSPDTSEFQKPLNLIKVGYSSIGTRDGEDKGLARLSEFKTSLINFKVLRLYVFDRDDFAGENSKKNDAHARKANLVEKRLHDHIEYELNPPMIRISFNDSPIKSEWFSVPERKVEKFLKSVDNYVFYHARYTPVAGTAFSSKTAKLLDFEPEAKVTGFEINETSGNVQQRKSLRVTSNKYALTEKQRKDREYTDKKKKEREVYFRENAKKLMKTVDFWKKVFVGREFTDKKMYDGDKGKYPKKIIDDIYETTAKGRKQPLVHYSPVLGKTRTSKKISEEDLDAASGSLSVNEMIDLYFPDLKKKYKESFEYFQMINGKSDIFLEE